METPKRREGLNELPQYVAFHQGLLKQSSGTEAHFNLDILVCGIMVCIMEYPRFSVLNQMEQLISIEKVDELISL